MPDVTVFEDGGYRFINGVFQYSAGVAAQPGFAVERARLTTPLPLAQGFAAIEKHLTRLNRPIAALCACELRSPAPFTEAGFVAFNRHYVSPLERWGIIRDGINPVARTNVCPAHNAPSEPVLYAFSYTMPSVAPPNSFIISGSGEAREGAATYAEAIVRLGEVSDGAMREKIRFVMQQMGARLTALGFGWGDAFSTQVYTVHDISSMIYQEIVERDAAPGGVEWHFCRPPVEQIEFEMDVRGAAREIMLRLA